MNKRDSCPSPSPPEEKNPALALSNDEMTEMLQCPVCLDVAFPPIHTCRKGHIVCNACQESSIICPLCEARFSYTRSYVGDKVFEKCVLPCRFLDDGCLKELPGAQLTQHHQECEFRPVRCTLCEGKWIDFSEYIKHLKEIHQMQSFDGPKRNCSTNITDMTQRRKKKFISTPYLFNGFGNTFLFQTIGNDDFLCAYVSLFGSQLDDIIHYEVAISVIPFGEQGKEMALHWKGSPVSFRVDPFKYVLEEGSGLIASLDAIRANSVEELIFHVSISEAEKEEEI